jgi:hypothetical protein
MIDDASIYPLIMEYPLKDEKYAKVARHFVALAVFDMHDIWMYPYSDITEKTIFDITRNEKILKEALNETDFLEYMENPEETVSESVEYQNIWKFNSIFAFAEVTKNFVLKNAIRYKFKDIYPNAFRKVGDPLYD